MLKKEKEVEEKKKIIEEKNNYNLNFEFNFSILKEKYNKIMTEKQLEVEKKERNIKELKENDLNINNNENEEKNNEFQIDNEIESKDFNKILELGKISFEKYISSVNKFNIKDM